MAKNRRKNPENSNELDAILEQLKQSYGSDSLNNNSKQSIIDDDISENDSELNAILGKIFSDEDSENDNIEESSDETTQDGINDKENSTITVAETSSLNDAAMELKDSVDYNTVDSFDAYDENPSHSSSEQSSNESFEQQSDTGNDAIEPSPSYDKITSEAVLNEEPPHYEEPSEVFQQDDISTSETKEALSVPNTNISIALEDDQFDSDVRDNKEEIYTRTVDASESFTEIDLLSVNSEEVINDVDFEEADDLQFPFSSESDAEDEPFAVEDEEYSVQDDRPKIVLSSEDYILDPLQEKLPDLKIHPKAYYSDLTNDTDNTDSNGSINNGIELNKNDISLLLKLGYDDEVKSQIGDENTQKVLYEKDSRFVPEANKTPFGFCNTEYNSKDQNREIKAKYKSQKKSLIIALVAISFLSLVLLATNLFFEFFSNRSSYLIVLGFEFLLITLIALIIYRKIYIGLLGIIRFDVNKYSILCYIILSYIIYGILSAIVYLSNKSQIDPSSLSVFGFGVSLYAVISIASDLMKCMQELATFELLISSDKIFTLELQKDHSELYNSDSLNNNESSVSKKHFYNQITYEICETSHITGFFKKTSQQRSDSTKYITLLGIIPVISVLMGCISAFVCDDLMHGASVMLLTSLLCTPLSCIGLPYAFEYFSANVLKKKNSAFIGFEAPESLAKADAIIFKDADAIEITSFTGIHPNNSADSKKSMEIAAEVFAALGGPLSSAFNSQERTISHNRSLIINAIADNGIDIYFDSSVNILIGDKMYLRSHNIKVKTDSNLSTATRGTEKSVIYMAINGTPKLGFIISSKIKDSFSKITSQLNNEGTKVFVKSYEPQINDLFFEQNKSSVASVAVHKPDVYESSHKVISDGSAVSTKNGISVAELIPIGKRISSHRKKIRKIITFTMLIGLLISALFVFMASIANNNPIIEAIQYHKSILFSSIFIAELLPGIIYLLKLMRDNKKSNNDKKQKNV